MFLKLSLLFVFERRAFCTVFTIYPPPSALVSYQGKIDRLRCYYPPIYLIILSHLLAPYGALNLTPPGDFQSNPTHLQLTVQYPSNRNWKTEKVVYNYLTGAA